MLNNLLIASGILSMPIRLIKTETAIVISETHLLLPYMVLSLLAVPAKSRVTVRISSMPVDCTTITSG